MERTEEMKLASVQFDSGVSPKICCVNLATADLGVDFSALIAALQTYVDKCVGPFWGVGCQLMRANKPAAKAWNLLLMNDADQADALGYHDLDKGGFPVLKVFVKTTLAAGELVSVTASHEVGEALCDPFCALWADGPKGLSYAYGEIADPVEEQNFAVNGIPMSNFVTVRWYESQRTSGQFDYLGKLSKPFQLDRGGYAIVRKAGKVSQIFGSDAKRKRFAKEDRRQHRSEFRRAA